MRPFRIAVTVTASLLAALPAAPAGAQSEGEDASAVRMIAVEGEAARYWSRWRGPSGQGLVEGTGYPDRWSETENVVWRAEVPGSGNSSPIVWGDTIVLTTAVAEGIEQEVGTGLTGSGREIDEMVEHRFVYRPHVEMSIVDRVERRTAELHVARMLDRGEAVEVDPGRYRVA